MSYTPAVKTVRDRDWVINGLRFESVYECEQYLADLRDRWFAITETVIKASGDPVNYVYRGGRCWPVGHDPEVE